MKIKAAILCGFLSLAGAFVAQAQTVLTDAWTVAGNAWTPASHPNYATDGIISADVGSQSGATITTSSKAGLYTNYFYSLFTTPTFTLATSNVLADVRTISFSVTIAGAFSSGPVLNFNASNSALSNYTFTAGATSDVGGFSAVTNTYTWDVTGLGSSSAFNIVWALPNHTAIGAVTLTQDINVSAVPEPSTYAAIFGGLVLVGAVARRRFVRKAAVAA